MRCVCRLALAGRGESLLLRTLAKFPGLARFLRRAFRRRLSSVERRDRFPASSTDLPAPLGALLCARLARMGSVADRVAGHLALRGAIFFAAPAGTGCGRW